MPPASHSLPPAPATPVRRVGRDTARWRDRLAVSLPVLLMAVLAGFTWWLVRNTPRAEAPRAARPVAHVVDYEMERFMTRRYEGGSLRVVVEGRQLRHYADDGTVEIDEVRLRAQDAGGRLYRAQAHLGVADAELREVRLDGAARVHREAQPSAGTGALELRGEQLWMDTQAQRVRSQRPVQLVSETGTLTAGTLDHDGRAGVTLLGARVRGRYLAPRP